MKVGYLLKNSAVMFIQLVISKKSIGMTTSISSFYDSYANNGSGAWAVGSIIDPKDNSGKMFLNNLIHQSRSQLRIDSFYQFQYKII